MNHSMREGLILAVALGLALAAAEALTANIGPKDSVASTALVDNLFPSQLSASQGGIGSSSDGN